MFEDDDVFISRPAGGVNTADGAQVTLFGTGQGNAYAPEIRDHLKPAPLIAVPDPLTVAETNAAEALPEVPIDQKLPDGWEEQVDETNGTAFYVNKFSGDRQTERPTMPGNAVPSDYARTGRLEVGWPVSAVWENGRWYDGGFIADHNPDGTYRIWWPGWGNFSESISRDEIELAPFFKPPMLSVPKKPEGPAAPAELTSEELVQKFDQDAEKLWKQLIKVSPDLETEIAKYQESSAGPDDPLPEGWLEEKDEESGEVLFYINEDTGDRQMERPIAATDENTKWNVQLLEEDLKLQMASKGMATISLVDIVGAGEDKLLPGEVKERDSELDKLDQTPWIEGACCFAQWTDGNYYPGIVRGENDDGSFRIFWPRWSNESHMVASANMMRPAPVMLSQTPTGNPNGDPTAAYACGSEIFAEWVDRRYHAGTIVANNADGSYRVLWKRWQTESDGVRADTIVLQMKCPQCEAICQATGNFCLSCGFSFNGAANASMHGENWQATMTQTGWGNRDKQFDRIEDYDRRMRNRRGWQPLQAEPEVDINTLGKSVYGHISERTQIIPKNNEVHLW